MSLFDTIIGVVGLLLVSAFCAVFAMEMLRSLPEVYQDSRLGRWERGWRVRRWRRRVRRMDHEALLDEFRAITYAQSDLGAATADLREAATTVPSTVGRWTRRPVMNLRRRIKSVEQTNERLAGDLADVERVIAAALARMENAAGVDNFASWLEQRRAEAKAERRYLEGHDH